MDSRDRGFATELVYGTLRLQGRLDYFLIMLSHRPLDELDLQMLIVLRMGLFQLIDLKMPPHAAIYETTELAKAVLGKSAASFVHAILRSAERSPLELPTGDDDRSLGIQYSEPEWIVRALSDARGDRTKLKALLEAQNQPAAPTLNSLPSLCTEEELIAAGAEKIQGSLRGYSYKGNPGDIPAVREHRALVQDLGSQLVVEEFFSAGGEIGKRGKLRWLDLCAGPGGKAAYLDSLITEGEFVANEISEVRSNLVRNLLRRGKVTTFDGRQAKTHLGQFDRILIDAPCTGLGALRRRPEVRWRRQPSDLSELQNLQRELLHASSEMINIGGIIGYSTCSPHLAETKLQVRRFLNEHSNFQRVSVSALRADKDGDMQLWTDRDGTDSMFLALLQRTS